MEDTKGEINLLKIRRKEREEEMIEKLADLEHEQWIAWSKNISENENLSKGRLERWKKLWIPYLELSEEVKEHDRVWAIKALKILEEFK